MSEIIEVQQDEVERAVHVISDALIVAGVGELEGAMAMLSILQVLKRRGLDIRLEANDVQ